jgi:hypothetical protein
MPRAWSRRRLGSRSRSRAAHGAPPEPARAWRRRAPLCAVPGESAALTEKNNQAAFGWAGEDGKDELGNPAGFRRPTLRVK